MVDVRRTDVLVHGDKGLRVGSEIQLSYETGPSVSKRTDIARADGLSLLRTTDDMPGGIRSGLQRHQEGPDIDPATRETFDAYPWRSPEPGQPRRCCWPRHRWWRESALLRELQRNSSV
ncbi:hypothetical protein [Streptomyces sp. NPDC057909]|uniref:hypothetical protein n=1 Tax=Streptomyces sp. NPDC057909 TaxID=3346277 RepID=UPI0036E3830E